MKTSKQLKEQLTQIKKDAAASVCEFLGVRDSIKISVDIDDTSFARRLSARMVRSLSKCANRNHTNTIYVRTSTKW